MFNKLCMLDLTVVVVIFGRYRLLEDFGKFNFLRICNILICKYPTVEFCIIILSLIFFLFINLYLLECLILLLVCLSIATSRGGGGFQYKRSIYFYIVLFCVTR